MSDLYRRDDWTLFRSTQTLAQKAGVPVNRLARLVIKELADNALDLGGTCRLDELEGGVAVHDDGPGIPAELLGELFSIARPLTSSKLIRLPTRGALGNGLRVVAGAVLASNGTLTVMTGGRTYAIGPRDDGGADVTPNGAWDGCGTRIEVRFGPALAADGDALDWAGMAMTLARGEFYRGKSSPHWYDGDSFYELLQAAGGRPLRAELEKLEGLSGSVTSDLLRSLGLTGRAANALSRDDVAAVLAAAQQRARPVPAKRLGAAGAAAFPDYAYAVERIEHRLPRGRAGQGPLIPAVIEAWALCLPGVPGHQPLARVRLCVNRTPVTAEVDSYALKGDLVVVGCGLRHRVADLGRASAVVVINVITPAVALTSDGKAPDLGALVGPIGAAIDGAIRRAKRARLALGIDRPLTKKDAILDLLPRAVAFVSENGRRRYTLRQLFYVIRPLVSEAIGGDDLQYATFTGVIDLAEREHGPLAGMVREPRGQLYQPHVAGDIPLGTLQVERYQRPAWTFNKILFIEKTSLAQLLVEERWHDRHDCAVCSSSGHATRAIKDLLDLLGDGDEPITVFAIHDADAAGTVIYEALVGETTARPGRRVDIINLGLEPWQAEQMGLPVEDVPAEPGAKHRPVADYVSEEGEEWEDWLQRHRVELNAMTPQAFIDWLDDVMAEHDAGKVIPPGDVLRDHLDNVAEEAITERIHARILAEARADDQVNEALRRADDALDALADDLHQRLPDVLDGVIVGWRPVADEETRAEVGELARTGEFDNLLGQADEAGDSAG